ncbi:hypothetical protein IFM89_014519 [Coptis chinensis]|uniref:Extradiol ring-cleavage dioxygenase class III enzyme subunit B domain-containing protein n=1 Tax=Coptis chinensis TaxID=261450 RepID=A0A835HD75_9MAGN|nr:hypothetical protein IFM89_014519 [Coptis chinensis]
MYPNADIPVCQLSIQTNKDGTYHYNIGKALAPLREEGVLIFGSRSATHNLKEMDVNHYDKKAPYGKKAHPYPDHFYPLHVALGAVGDKSKGQQDNNIFITIFPPLGLVKIKFYDAFKSDGYHDTLAVAERDNEGSFQAWIRHKLLLPVSVLHLLRWGEKYDGHGSSIKYTDKCPECLEDDEWTKWGDKWDENFNQYSQGVKQGETWWEGKYGERWNHTWGGGERKGHDGSGWVHKYGKSSCGEHWDTHVQQDTWYERYLHFDFQHCFENSVQLREVHKPPPET